MTQVYCGVGSNLNHPVQQVHQCITRIESRFSNVRSSPLYRTPAWGGIKQPDFVNAVLGFKTNLAPQALLASLQSIESDLGRTRGETKWGPRVIDLDLLLYGNLCIDSQNLKVPHPWMKQRAFVLTPLSVLAPDLIFPCGTPLVTCMQDPLIVLQSRQLCRLKTVHAC